MCLNIMMNKCMFIIVLYSVKILIINGMQVASQEMKKAYLPVLPSGDFTKSQLRVRAMQQVRH